MKMLRYLIIVLFCTNLYAQDKSLIGNNVILITIDGVRWQDIINGPDPLIDPLDGKPTMPILRGELLNKGIFLGNQNKKSKMEIANYMKISLPAYFSIFSGVTTTCRTNVCDQISDETFAQKIKKELNLNRYKVATISSWDRIDRSVENKKGELFVNAGNVALDDLTADIEFEQINYQQIGHPPEWSDARKDEFTWAHGIHYIKKYRPRFLYLSFNDTDEWAHKSNYPEYVKAMRFHDGKIKELFELLEKLKGYGENTTVIITTDHGRGEGSYWSDHHPLIGGAENIWMYIRGPFTPQLGDITLPFVPTHRDIRPTIEALMGLIPERSVNRGRILNKIIQDLPELN